MNHEEKARLNKSMGNNCSVSLYKAFSEDLELSQDFPQPRSIEGKCGALLVSLKILKELNYEDKQEEFEKEFINKFGYTKCMELITHGRRCNDYVGECAKMLDEIINTK